MSFEADRLNDLLERAVSAANSVLAHDARPHEPVFSVERVELAGRHLHGEEWREHGPRLVYIRRGR